MGRRRPNPSPLSTQPRPRPADTASRIHDQQQVRGKGNRMGPPEPRARVSGGLREPTVSLRSRRSPQSGLHRQLVGRSDAPDADSRITDATLFAPPQAQMSAARRANAAGQKDPPKTTQASPRASPEVARALVVAAGRGAPPGSRATGSRRWKGLGPHSAREARFAPASRRSRYRVGASDKSGGLRRRRCAKPA